jgi:mannosyltransferase
LVAIDAPILRDLQLIVPNLHRRYSGVTATNRMTSSNYGDVVRR